MTTPSKTCTRLRWPSITWKCTRTVSPALKSGRSSRNCLRSRMSIGVLIERGPRGPTDNASKRLPFSAGRERPGRGEHLVDEQREMRWARLRMEDARAERFAALVHRSGHERTPTALHGLGERVVELLELLRRAALRPGTKGHDGSLRRCSQLELGLPLHQRRQLAGEPVRTR